MSAYNRLLENTKIFAIASMGSKLLSIILVPFYTYVLSTEEYGTVDMMITTLSLLLPIISLSIFDATLRFSIKSNYSKQSILTSSLLITLLGNIIFLILFPIISRIPIISEYTELFYLLIFLQSLNLLLSQFARGIGEVKLFAINGILTTFYTLTLNIILLFVLKFKIEGYLISYIIAYVLSTLYVIFRLKIWKYIKKDSYNVEISREMLKYSIPLIPNALMWWLMNVSDRYIITLFLGISSNGIYAVANKIPSILNLIYTIFAQSWQLSAIEESNSETKSQFYSQVFYFFYSIMFIATGGILVIIKPLVSSIVSADYIHSWRYVPFLLLAVVFTSFSSFLGTNYIAMKDTKGIFKTLVYGAILNITLNFLLIPLLSLNGAAIATMLSFLLVWLYRLKDTRRFVIIIINWKIFIINFVIIFIQIIVLYCNLMFFIEYSIQTCLFILLLISNHKLISFVFVNYKNIINKSNSK